MYDNTIMYMYKYVKIIMYDKSVMCDKIGNLRYIISQDNN